MKYKGFTLIEMSLALSLMGAMMLLGTEVWSILQQIHGLYADGQQARYEEIRLRHILEEDISFMSNWQQEDQKLFILDEQQDTLLAYYFGKQAVIRTHRQHTDSFDFALSLQALGESSLICLKDSGANVWFLRNAWRSASALP